MYINEYMSMKKKFYKALPFFFWNKRSTKKKKSEKKSTTRILYTWNCIRFFYRY